MAYAAVISLKQTIHYLLNSCHISIISSNREILESAYKQLTSLQESLTRSDDSSSKMRKRLNALHTQIRGAVHQLQDSLESHVSNQFLSIHGEREINSSPPLPLELDLKEVWPEITSFTEAATKMEKHYIQELERPPLEEDDDDDHNSSAASPTDCSVKMVGLSDAITDMKDHMLRIIRPEDFGVFSFFGAAGNGRSVVMKTIYDDIYASFDCGAWVRIASKYQLKQILLNLIDQINQGHEFLVSEGEEKLGEYLYASLKGRRYIVALDDVRDTGILGKLRRWFPEQNNGSLVFVTSSLIEVAELEESFSCIDIPVVWDELSSWTSIQLLIMSRGWEFTPAFEEAGKKIAKNCRGFRLVLVKVMLALLRSEKTLKFWNKLAADADHPIFMVDDEISEEIQIKGCLGEDDGVWANDSFDFSITIGKVMEHLYPERLFPKMGIMTVYGMAGIGKTTLIRKVFGDFSVVHRFNHRAWVNIGPEYHLKEILIDILAQIYPHIDKTIMKEDAKLVEDLCVQLSDKKCLIVLDDLWSQEPVHFLKNIMPNIKGELVLTTRLLKVGLFGPSDRVYKVRLLNKDESWDLLREKVFVGELCPSQLVKVGKKIAENCEGLPLLILAVADLLSKSEKTLEYWNKVAEKRNPAVMNAQSELSKGLLPSYETLPQHLKACFLYMGVFPQNHEIPTSTLIRLWFADGFLEPNPSQTVEEFASKCFKELADRTMVMVKKGSDLKTNKTCSLHSIYWHLSCNAATTNEFFLALDDTYVEKYSMESMKSQRRLCIRTSFLFRIKDSYNAMASASTSRALLCTGPSHQYPVQLCFTSRLLKVLDTLAIRFYDFPIEVVKLIHLRYLTLTCDGELPPSISKLLNLQFLIVRQYLSVRESSYLPKEIWNMKELKHLQISGSKLPNPDCAALLPNLTSLLEVSVHSCTRRVLKRIPNLKKLGIQIELEPNDKSNPFHNLNRISRLRRLESLKCVIVNPELGPAPPPPRSMFPTSLKKLCLSGLGYPWEHMSIIGKLPNLEVLKLQCYAFQGPIWKVDYSELYQLKFLSIEDTDLVRWDLKMPSMSHLQHLSIKHCYQLEQLPSCLPPIVQMFEVIDSHPLAVNMAKKLKEVNWEIRRIKTLELNVESSWNDDDDN